MLDTHAAVKELVETGMAEEQAEAVVKVANSVHGQLATKADLQILESKISTLDGKIATLDGKIATLDGKIALLESTIEQVETRLMARMTGVNLAIGGLIVAIVKLL